MEEYWITFRLGDSGNYNARYSAFIDAIADNSTARWSDPTSFWIIESSLDIAQLCAKLSEPLNARTDMFVIRKLANKTSRYFGNVEALDILQSFMPEIKKA